MFNPKNNSILDEQLSTSGLEMSIGPLGIISAGLGIVKGVSSIAGASSQASAQSAAYKEQKKYAKKVAKETNKYNKKRFEADKANFLAMREYNFETALTKWKYDRSIQKYEFEQQMRAFEKDQQNLSNTLETNKIASRQGYVAEQRVMREIAAEQAFARQDSYIESLQTEGRARLGAAGRSNDRAVAMTAAEHGRNLAILDASFTSSLMQHDMNMFDIAFQKFGADLNARASAMLRPEKLPSIPRPNKPPEPVWVEPAEVIPSYTPKPNTAGTIMGGITGAASAAVDVAGAFLN